jgi:hypothetical protein
MGKDKANHFKKLKTMKIPHARAFWIICLFREGEDHMSDVKGLEVSDVLGLSQPLTKLIETISNGVGTLYKPVHLKRMAKAKAEEIRLISEAITQNAILPISYQHGSIDIDSTDVQNLLLRAEQRLLLDEMKKQQNIDAIVANAAEELRGKEKVSDTPVDEDWSSRFQNIAKDISSEEMQFIWGKVLASEVENPGSFSLRTLETIRNLSKTEASRFQGILPFVIEMKGECFLASNEDIMEKYGMMYADIMILNECGLVELSGISYNPMMKKGDAWEMFTDERVAVVAGSSETAVKVTFSAYALTNAGRELYRILAHAPNNEYFMDVCGYIFKKNTSKIGMTVHRAFKKESGNLVYYKEALRVFKHATTTEAK